MLEGSVKFFSRFIDGNSIKGYQEEIEVYSHQIKQMQKRKCSDFFINSIEECVKLYSRLIDSS